MNSLARIRLLIATLWAGSLWTVGYLVAPTLFVTLSDRVLAGAIAGAMFHSEAWLSIVCGLLLLGLFSAAQEIDAKRRRLLLVTVVLMLLGTLVSHFGLQPLMADLRSAAGPGGVMESAAKSRFGMLHGISSVIYLLQSLLAGLLIWKLQ